jgi:hypothetical protein
MGVDYSAKLVFGYTEDQVKNGPALYQIKGFLEDYDFQESKKEDENEEFDPDWAFDQYDIHYYPSKDEVERVRESGIEIVSLGSTMGGDSEDILSIGEANYSVSVYRRMVIKPENIMVKPEWLAAFDLIIRYFGIEFDGEPKWYLGGEQW